MNHTLTLVFGLLICCGSYIAYRLQIEKNKRKLHKQTRSTLRDADENRDAKMVEAVRNSLEYDGNKYEGEEWR
jgi:uncharacterized membrane protein YciS (DUF1049 family)